MKRSRRWSLYLAAALALFAVSLSDARAQFDRSPAIGIIDIQAVLRESAAVQSLSAKIEAERLAAQSGMQAREDALRAADMDLAQRRPFLAPEDYAEEREELEAEGVELQRQLQAQRRRLDQMFGQGMARVQQVLLQVSQDIARENNLDLVLAKTTVIIVRPEFDFTGVALQRLNAQLADVALPVTPN
jgi:Skp family chaperone for outer membrane proteins